MTHSQGIQPVKTLGVEPESRVPASRGLSFEVRLVLGVLAIINVVAAAAVAPDRGGDFSMLYDSTQAWLHGLPPYVSSQPTTNLNPPLLWLVVVPFTALPASMAYAAWTVISLCLFGVTARIAASAIRMPPIDIAVVVLSLTGTAFELGLGQISFVLLVPFTAAWLLDRSGRPIAAATCMGVLCALKPFFGLFVLVTLWRREWRALVACVGAALVAVAAGWVLAGTEGSLAWISNIRHVTWSWHIFNGSVWGVGTRLLSRQDMVLAAQWTPLSESPAGALAVGVVGTALVMTALWRSLGRADIDRTYAAVSIAALLVSPLGWNYYLVTVFGPVLATVARRPSRWLWPVGALAMCPYPLLVSRHYGVWGTLLVGQMTCAVVIGVFLLVVGQTDNEKPDRHHG